MTQEMDKYRLKEEIGHGGFATVYRAEHVTLSTEFAIKVFDRSLLDDEKARARIRLEAREASKLEHPHIVRMRQLIDTPEQVCMVMEYMPGGDLRRWQQKYLQGKPRGTQLPREEVLRIISEVAAALDYAHDCGVIHRDVKPGNILMDADGHAKLGDFGLVLPISEPRLTPAGNVVGTATYISPEQAGGNNEEVNGRSDQYSLAVVAYELLVGRPPFQGGTNSQISRMHMKEAPPAPSSLNRNLPDELDRALCKALDKTPDERYDDCAAFARALDKAFQAADQRRFPDLLQKANDLMVARKFGDCSRCLDEAGRCIPQGPNRQAAEDEWKELKGRLVAYQAMVNNWDSAMEKAKAAREVMPKFPDPQGVFVTLGLRPWLLMHLPRREMMLQAAMGLLLGGLGALVAYLVAVYFIVRY